MKSLKLIATVTCTFIVVSTCGCIETVELFEEFTTPDPPVIPPRTKDLGFLSEDGNRFALAINDHGVVIGYAAIEEGGDHGFRWTEETGMVDLGTSGGPQSRAFDINNNGDICGVSQPAVEGDPVEAVIWRASGEIDVLPSLAGGNSEANAINDLGQVCGNSDNEDGISRAVMWDTDGTIIELGSLGGTRSIASDLNNVGQVVGTSEIVDGSGGQAFIWTAETGIVGLGTLGGDLSESFCINDLGQVGGRSNRAPGANRYGFVWTPDGGFVDMDTLGGIGSQVFDLNEDGTIVGTSSVGGAGQKGFVGTIGAGIFQLPDLDSTATNAARGINAHGVFVGFANDPDRVARAIMWVE